MLSHSSVRAVNPFKIHLTSVCHLLRIPLEIRDFIYAMLLTTPYCTTFDSTGSFLEFHLHAAILSVNKKISAEAARVLYQENDFIILKTTGRHLYKFHDRALIFDLLPENKITSPLLRIEIAVVDGRRRQAEGTRTVITTLEGLQTIISALWALFDGPDDEYDHNSHPWVCLSDLRLILNFNLKAESRYQVLSELMLKPWDTINGVKELILKGDIKEPMRKHLEKSNLKGLGPDDVTARFEKFHLIAERYFEQKDYTSALWWWQVLDDYWCYIFSFRASCLEGRRMCLKGDGLLGPLKKSYYLYYKGILKVVITCLGQSQYADAVKYAYEGLEKMENCSFWDFGSNLPGIMRIKLYLSATLGLFVRGMITEGVEYLEVAATVSEDWNLNTEMNEAEIMEDLKVTVDNELRRLKSPWRCGRHLPVSLTRQEGPDWQVGECQRSFWEWLELPEERDLAWEKEL
jgi:hypothetical protein